MGSTSQQLYSLTWGEFGTSLVSAVQLLRCHGDMVDVTLAAGGRSFPAHKIVLCAASPFLLNLLKSTPCKHPVVLLAGVGANDLEALLEFVYRGEVSVDPNQLPSLLQAAHCLNIQGLSPGTMGSEKSDETAVATGSGEALTRDVINSFLPLRRRKRAKRRASTGSGSGGGGGGEGKWARTDAGAENRPCEGAEGQEGGEGRQPGKGEDDIAPTTETSPAAGAEDDGQQDESANALDPGLDPPTGITKSRGPSEQPGVCPLCCATLRQARNLRRHLLTSCKFRMTPEQLSLSSLCGPPAATVALLSPHLHQPWSPIKTQGYEQIVCKVSPTHLPVCSETVTADYGNKKNSVSDQPATCPLCNATLRQSRNLRRHLELLHFGAGRPTVRVRSRRDRPLRSGGGGGGEGVGEDASSSNPDSPPAPPPPDQNAQVNSTSRAGLRSPPLHSHTPPAVVPMTRPDTMAVSQHDVVSQSVATTQYAAVSPMSTPQHSHGPSMMQQMSPQQHLGSMSHHFVSPQPSLMSMNHMSHMSSPHLMGPPPPSHLGRIDNVHNLLPPPPPSHDGGLYRHQHHQHHPHGDLLRGAGLYADTRSDHGSGGRQDAS